jgi:hypothetical protein
VTFFTAFFGVALTTVFCVDFFVDFFVDFRTGVTMSG